MIIAKRTQSTSTIAATASRNLQTTVDFSTQLSFLMLTFRRLDDFACQPEKVRQQLERDLSNCKGVYLTVCLDVFADFVAPGVSAQTPLGLVPAQVMPLIKSIAQSGKLLSFDIAELSPKYDLDSKTAALAAYLFAQILSYMH